MHTKSRIGMDRRNGHRYLNNVTHLIRLETFIRDAFIQNQHLVAVFFAQIEKMKLLLIAFE